MIIKLLLVTDWPLKLNTLGPLCLWQCFEVVYQVGKPFIVHLGCMNWIIISISIKTPTNSMGVRGSTSPKHGFHQKMQHSMVTMIGINLLEAAGAENGVNIIFRFVTMISINFMEAAGVASIY